MISSAVHDNITKDMDLSAGERVVLVVHRHPVMLLLRLLPALALVGFAAALAWYRSVGGLFLVTDAVEQWQFTGLDRLLMGVLLSSLIGWVFTRRRNMLSVGLRRALLVGALLQLALLIFRSRGGRVFYIDPFAATGLDGLNLFLGLTTVLGVAYSVYTYLDWANDQMVMTNQRIILDNDQLLIRREQEQLDVGDIQNVLARTETYLEHWLNFGTIIIQSASARDRLLFRAASNPLPAQQQIMAELKNLRRQRNEKDLRRMLDKAVFDNGAKAEAGPARRSVKEGQFGLFVRENPQYEASTKTYTWNPHWVELVKALFKPVAWLLLTLALVVAASMGGLLADGAALVVVALVLLALGGWIAYAVEDFRNERYVLTPATVIDIAKKPLGPESRRSAKLDALQNVFYRTTLISQILGYGNVTLETAGAGGAFTFKSIPNPREVVSLIHEYQSAYRKAEEEKNLETSLILLREYHRSTQTRVVQPELQA